MGEGPLPHSAHVLYEFLTSSSHPHDNGTLETSLGKMAGDMCVWSSVGGDITGCDWKAQISRLCLKRGS